MIIRFSILALLLTSLSSCIRCNEPWEEPPLQSTQEPSGGAVVYVNPDHTLNGAGTFLLDLNADENPELIFEIINLNELNSQPLPAGYDTLAARARILNGSLHDNSTHQYLSAFDGGEVLTDDGLWTAEQGVLGTFHSAGQFQGEGEKYLGFRIPHSSHTGSAPVFTYGWVRLECEAHSQWLRIIDAAWNQAPNASLATGNH